jgi:hypothetical protein
MLLILSYRHLNSWLIHHSTGMGITNDGWWHRQPNLELLHVSKTGKNNAIYSQLTYI